MDYYVLTDPNHPNAPISTSASVPNIAVRQFASTIVSWNSSTSTWECDWSTVDAALTYLPSGAKWSLSVALGVQAPPVLFTMGDAVYSFTYAGHSFQMAVPWGINSLSCQEAIIASAAQKYGTNAQLHHVVFGINGLTQETTLPNPTDTWWTTTGGYTPTTVVNLWHILQSYMSGHWPAAKYMCADFVPNNFPPNSPPPTPPPDEGVVLMNDFAGNYPHRSCVQNNGVGMVGDPPQPFIWSDIVSAGAAIFGFQEVGALGSNAVTCANAAASAGAAYFEIYPSDLSYF